jgi:Maltose acetyltransferase hexapeptide capping motif
MIGGETYDALDPELTVGRARARLMAFNSEPDGPAGRRWIGGEADQLTPVV